MDEAAFEMDEDDGLSTEREMVWLLARDVAWYATAEQLNAAINSLVDIIGSTLMECISSYRVEGNLNDAERRAVVINAIGRVWRVRLQGRAPTQDEFSQVICDTIRAVGDDPTYGLPSKRRRTRTRRPKHDCQVLSLVTPATPVHHHGSDDNADENEDHKS